MFFREGVAKRIEEVERLESAEAGGAVAERQAVRVHGTDNQHVAVALSGLLGALHGERRHQVGVVRGTSHVEIVDVLAVEQTVIADLSDGASSVTLSLHVELVTGQVRETVLGLVGQSGRCERIAGRSSGGVRIGVVRAVVVLLGSLVGESEEQRLHRHDEVELQAVLTGNVLLSVLLLELLDDDVLDLILVGLALLIGDEDVLGPVTSLANLEGLASGDVQNGREVDGGRLLVNPLRGVVDNIGRNVLLNADEIAQISLHDELLLHVVQRSAAQGQGVARIARVVEGGGQLDHGGGQRGSKRLQSSRVPNESLVQSPLGSIATVLRDEIETDILVRLSDEIVELQGTLLPDVVRQIPGVGNAPLQLSVVGGLDGQTGSGGLNPRRGREISRLRELERRRVVGSVVLVWSRDLGVPRVHLHVAGEQSRHLLASVKSLIRLIVGRQIDVTHIDCSGWFGHLGC